MVWAKAALVGGLLVVCAAFAVGVELRTSAVVGGGTQDCGSAIPTSWLVSGTPDRTSSDPGVTPDGRRAAAACRPVVRESRRLVLAATGAGALVATAGWSSIRRRPSSTAPPASLHPAGQP